MKNEYRFIAIKNGVVCKGNRRICALKKFPDMYAEFVGRPKTENTRELESRGAQIAKGKVSDSKSLWEFFDDVCKWGDISRIRGKVEKRKNGKREVAAGIRDAAVHLQQSDVQGALDVLMEIKNIKEAGASKTVRMLAPNKAAALDKHLKDKLGIRADEYAEWCADCVRLAKVLQANHKRPGGKWKAADAEAVIFDAVKIW